MLVTCTTVEGFLKNLATADAGDILSKAVWVEISYREIDEVRSMANFQASAVVAIGDGEYLLQVGVDCGVDYNDASQELKGTAEAGQLMRMIDEFCTLKGLEIRPGVIGF